LDRRFPQTENFQFSVVNKELN